MSILQKKKAIDVCILHKKRKSMQNEYVIKKSICKVNAEKKKYRKIAPWGSMQNAYIVKKSICKMNMLVYAKCIWQQ